MRTQYPVRSVRKVEVLSVVAKTPTGNCPRCKELRQAMRERERAGLPLEKPQFGHKWWPMCSAECVRADREYNRARLAAKGQLATTPSSRKRLPPVTPEKKEYDDLAVEHFRSHLRWKAAFVTGRPGRRLADVLAVRVRRNSLAVIEVKGPHESRSWARWEGDWEDLSAKLEACHGAYLRTARKRACDVLPRRSSSRTQLYAMTIASQLYRYYFEFEERATEYDRSAPLGIKLTGKRKQFSKLPFLVVPAKYARELRTATEALAAHGFVVSPSFETTPRLAMASFSYP